MIFQEGDKAQQRIFLTLLARMGFLAPDMMYEKSHHKRLGGTNPVRSDPARRSTAQGCRMNAHYHRESSSKDTERHPSPRWLLSIQSWSMDTVHPD